MKLDADGSVVIQQERKWGRVLKRSNLDRVDNDDIRTRHEISQ